MSFSSNLNLRKVSSKESGISNIKKTKTNLLLHKLLMNSFLKTNMKKLPMASK